MVQDEALNKSRLLLFEHPALEAEPQHEVARGMGRNLSPGRDTVRPNARFSGINCSWTIPWV